MLAIFGWFLVKAPKAIYDDIRSGAYRRRRHRHALQWREREWVDFYGEHHWAERARYAETIRLHGGECMERTCVMATRRIAPGAKWHLAHDHEAGGHDQYLGPAHPECNMAEARARGVVWEGMEDNHAQVEDVAGFEPDQATQPAKTTKFSNVEAPAQLAAQHQEAPPYRDDEAPSIADDPWYEPITLDADDVGCNYPGEGRSTEDPPF